MDERENIREDSPAEEGIGKTGRGKKILLAAVIFIAAISLPVIFHPGGTVTIRYRKNSILWNIRMSMTTGKC